MKLYTEQQVKQAIKMARSSYNLFTTPFIYDQHEVLEKLTPIQLPSDEEIKKMMDLDGMEFDEFDPYDVSYLGGATWIRNKIQGGEQ